MCAIAWRNRFEPRLVHVPTPRGTPDKLKERALFQIDSCLETIRSGAHQAINLRSRTVEGHVATGFIWSALEGLRGIRVTRLDLGEWDFHLRPDATHFALAWNGDMHVVEPLAGRQCLATIRAVGGDIENSALGTWMDLTDELGVTAVICKLAKVIGNLLVIGTNVAQTFWNFWPTLFRKCQVEA